MKIMHRNQKKIIHLTVSSLNNDKCRTVAMVENTSIMFFGHNKGSAVKLTIIWDKLENVHNPWSLRLWSWWWKLHPNQCNRSFLSELLCASALGSLKLISSLGKIGTARPRGTLPHGTLTLMGHWPWWDTILKSVQKYWDTLFYTVIYNT